MRQSQSMSKRTPIAAPAPQPDPPADAPAAVDEADLLPASVARIEHGLRLDELAEIAMKLARDVTEQSLATKAACADAPAAEAPPPDAADQFAKLSCAVRLSVNLAGRLEESLRALRTCGPAAGEPISPKSAMALAYEGKISINQIVISNTTLELPAWNLPEPARLQPRPCQNLPRGAGGPLPYFVFSCR
jgi:hypothetical protein